MFDARNFFSERFSNHMKETNRYLKYIFNEHLAIFIFFLISATAVFYQQWLKQVPENFPTTIIMSFVLALLITFIPIRTLLKEPDLYFLLPAEQQMGPYFRRGLVYSYFLHLFIVLLVM